LVAGCGQRVAAHFFAVERRDPALKFQTRNVSGRENFHVDGLTLTIASNSPENLRPWVNICQFVEM
jgi:hypothetical protein